MAQNPVINGAPDPARVAEPPDDLQVAKTRVTELASGLAGPSSFLEAVVIIGICVGVVGGLAIAARTEPGFNGMASHPFAVEGLSLAVGALLLGLFYWVIVRAIRLFAAYSKFQVESDTERHLAQWEGRSARSKRCPCCIEDVWDQAHVCPFCRYQFTPARTTVSR